MTRFRRIGIGAAIGVVPLVLLAAACASSGPDPDPAAASQPASLQAYLGCLGEHGITVPSLAGRPSADARASGTFGPRPSGGARPSGLGGGAGVGGFGGGAGAGGFGGGFLGTQAPTGVDQSTWDAATAACAAVRPTAGASGARGDDSATRAYRNCLADHGVAQGGPLNTADPAVAAAVGTCEPLRPTPSPTG